MDGTSPAEFLFDFRTGRPTAIGSSSCAEQRAACSAINRERTSRILEAAQQPSPRQSVSADVWNAAFAREAVRREVPLISLEALGIYHDSDGLRSSKYLLPLKPGAEASPYLDQEFQAVYKLFDLRNNGGLGKKIALTETPDGRYELNPVDARLSDTLLKLSILNDAGALPTEIVGLSNTGDYLIVKQPQARDSLDFEKDRQKAIEAVLGEVPLFTGLRGTVVVVHVNGVPYLVSDLHNRNIMIDAEGRPTIIDALVGEISPDALGRLAWLRDSVEDARDRRHGLQPKQRIAFGDDVDDSEL